RVIVLRKNVGLRRFTIRRVSGNFKGWFLRRAPNSRMDLGYLQSILPDFNFDKVVNACAQGTWLLNDPERAERAVGRALVKLTLTRRDRKDNIARAERNKVQ